MAIDASRILRVHESCLSLLKAKKNPYINTRDLNVFFQRFQLNSKEKRNISVEYIQEGILKLMWILWKKLCSFEFLQDQHKKGIASLQFKIEAVKSSSEISKMEDQLLLEMQTLVKEREQNMNPIEYYNIKFRKDLKTVIESKLLHLKISLSKSHHNSAPRYSRKLENQFKENFISIYYEELRIDRQLLDMINSFKKEVLQQIKQLDNQICQNVAHHQMDLGNNYFIRYADEILSRPRKLNERKLLQYVQNLKQALRTNYQFWLILRQSLDYLLSFINQLQKVLIKTNNDFCQKQQMTSKFLASVLKSVAHLFHVELIYDLAQLNNSFFETITTYSYLNFRFQSYKQKILKRRDFSLKKQNQCRDFLSRLQSQIKQRQANFLHYALIDKKFFEDQAKSQKIISRLLILNFHDFLGSVKNLFQSTIESLNLNPVLQLQQHQVISALSQLIINQFEGHQQTDINCIQKQESNQSNNKKSLIRQKIEKLQRFVDNFIVLPSTDVPVNDKYFSCSLGPRLLLHGKLHLLPEGLFFQSHFNKKNLLFGKTKIFIPKSDILDLDMKNSLLVFPDTVLVKTCRGIVSFHSLGKRKTISEAIKSAYFQENHEQNEKEKENSKNEKNLFQPADESFKPPDDRIQKYIKPLQIIVNQTILKGSNLGSVFRSYFSDDKFEIKGKEYQNFKNFSILLIGGKNPICTPLTPSKPTYFQYKSQKLAQNYPESSTRNHKYLKDLPKIPFLSKGEEGECQQKQEYIWLGPQLMVINVLSRVKGLSLIEGMQIHLKYVFKQITQGVKITISSQIKFTKQLPSNRLIKGPTNTNIRQAVQKIMNAIQQCERSRQGTPKIQKQEAIVGQKLEKTRDPIQAIKLTKEQVLLFCMGFFILYVVTILTMRLL